MACADDADFHGWLRMDMRGECRCVSPQDNRQARPQFLVWCPEVALNADVPNAGQHSLSALTNSSEASQYRMTKTFWTFLLQSWQAKSLVPPS
jgi:hypothetical protein